VSRLDDISIVMFFEEDSLNHPLQGDEVVCHQCGGLKAFFKYHNKNAT